MRWSIKIAWGLTAAAVALTLIDYTNPAILLILGLALAISRI